jgi:isopentenyldiphosphate isomerase
MEAKIDYNGRKIRIDYELHIYKDCKNVEHYEPTIKYKNNVFKGKNKNDLDKIVEDFKRSLE